MYTIIVITLIISAIVAIIGMANMLDEIVVGGFSAMMVTFLIGFPITIKDADIDYHKQRIIEITKQKQDRINQLKEQIKENK